MKRLSPEAFGRARRLLKTEARPVDRAMFDYRFERASAERSSRSRGAAADSTPAEVDRAVVCGECAPAQGDYGTRPCQVPGHRRGSACGG